MNASTNGSAGHEASAAERMSEQAIARRIQAGHLLNHHGANAMYAQVSALANQLGLSAQQKANITPYPTPVSNVNFNGGADSGLVEIVKMLLDERQQPATPKVPVPAEPVSPPAIAPTLEETESRLPRWVKPLAWLLVGGLMTVTGQATWNHFYPPAAAVAPAEPSDLEVTIR